MTLGQVAHAAYRKWSTGKPPVSDWDDLTPDQRTAWEVAASAVEYRVANGGV